MEKCHLIDKLFEATRTSVSQNTYPGYPSTRLVMEDTEDISFTFQDGPWQASRDTLPTLEEQQVLLDKGYQLDDYGRPLHPWLKEMLTDPSVGVVTYKGAYWKWGPNYTADPIIITKESRPSVLLIQRSDTGKWALPGGFVDGSELALTAAKRELNEEAGLVITELPQAQIYKGIVADLRTTAHAWAETTAYLWKINTRQDLVAGDDANQAAWFYIDELPEELHGSHAALISEAIKYTHPKSLSEVLSLPNELLHITPAKGGHMAYERIIVQSSDRSLFAKIHNPTLFTDKEKERRSRNYLLKEHTVFEHLRKVRFEAIPAQTELIENHTLVMDALTDKEGWLWRAPLDEALRDKYIQDILLNFDRLQSLPLPQLPESPKMAYVSLVDEGWQTLTTTSCRQLIDLGSTWLPYMRAETQTVALELLEKIKTIRRKAPTTNHQGLTLFSHHDARQANIAWHPDHGAKLVDWSWADVGPRNSDATNFLIDLTKSGHNIEKYLETYFNEDHAMVLMGFWLGHSVWPAQGNQSQVRFHQFTSAVASYQLLKRSGYFD